MKYHLAQINIAKLIAPLDDPLIADFVNNLDRINGIAEQSKGFVWRLKDESGNSTAIDVFNDPMLIVNMSVWESIEDLKQFVYESGHLQIYLRKKEWFHDMDKAHMALWWVKSGELPTAQQGREKLEFLQKNGPSDLAFSFSKIFSAPNQ